MDRNENMKNLEGKVVDLSLYDDLSGIAEFIADRGEKVVIHWAQAHPCYDCLVYDESVYKEEEEVDKDDICDLSENHRYTLKDLESLRKQSLLDDRPIFERYYQFN